MEKMCKIHGKTAHVLRKNGYIRCKKCANEAVARRRRLIKVKAVNYMGGSCIRCGYNKCLSALSFHHTDPAKKDFSISNTGGTKSWKRVKNELDKCILVCQNCHAEIHQKEFQTNNPELDARLSNFNPISSKPAANKKSAKKIKTLCKCGKQIAKKNKQCKNCYQSGRPTKIQWPSTKQLIKMVEKTSFVAAGKKLGVSDNAIRKRIRNH